MTLLEMRDWIGFALGVVSFVLALFPYLSCPRTRTLERGWTVKTKRIEIVRHRRETDIRS